MTHFATADATLDLSAIFRPDWLSAAHHTLDAAVFAAYGWPSDLGDEEVLARLLGLNLARGA